MPPELVSYAAGFGVLLALLLVPGLLAPRASWTGVPFLSAAFWICSWWWLPLASGRRRFLLISLLLFAALALFRARRSREPSAPSWPVLLVLAAAIGRLVPFALWPVAPGADMSLHSLSTLLMVQHDGLPSSYEPLLPISTFGAYTPGLHALAADVSLLSGLTPHRAAFLVAVAAHALLQIALFGLLSRLFDPPVAALGSVLTLGMARVPQAFFGWGGNPTLLALAFVAAGWALLLRGEGRGSAAAAGFLLGAALVTHSMIAVVALCALPVAIDVLRRDFARQWPRAGLAALSALLAAGPFLWRLDFTLSPGERAWLAQHLVTQYAADWQRYSSVYPLAVLRYLVATLNDAFLIAAGLGVALALRARSAGLLAGALSALLLAGLVVTARWGGLGTLVVFPERAVALLALLMSVALALLVRSLLARRDLLGWGLLLLLAGIAVERTHRYYFAGASLVLVGGDDLRAMAWLREHTKPDAVVCNDYRTAALWVPALAHRTISAPHLPPFYVDEFRAGVRPCRLTYATGRFFGGPPERPARGAVAFESGPVKLLEHAPQTAPAR